ncbi:CRISPR-associated helicase/endonuclease Cas3 [Leifsonia sp. Leaf264]|uniref:CRISPR-associated helicase/endonuclease Cas3 n=1 Tax=Leifsonia sp. Leaf264 TaxID=1736314 RepID=UPI0006F3E0CA|nr:CRISPR-associated helicase/endonuclease Cas3 [Leifsonia sp. Leaf264]KQO98759.1 hypothetical protein ASF30_11905 [Leifsonia sp. Leaf264]
MASKPRAARQHAVDPALWGKLGKAPHAPYPLIKHSLDTSAAAFAVWDLWLRSGLRALLTEALAPGQPGKARSMFAALAGVHDIGKINVVFQGQLGAEGSDYYRGDFIADHLAALAAAGYDTAAPKNGRIGGDLDLDGPAGRAARRHEALTLLVVAGAWPGKFDKVADSWAAAVLGAHHGRYHPNDASFDQEHSRAGFGIDKKLAQFTAGRWGEQQQAHIHAVCDAAGVAPADLRTPLHAHGSTAVILLSGLVSLADWVASTGRTISGGRNAAADPVVDPSGYLQERTGDLPAILTATLGVYQDIKDPVADVMRKHKDNLSPLQKQSLTVGRGLWVVTVPAGDGKTEAALLRHSNCPGEGLLFALPTRATTDAMWVRVRRTYMRTPNYAAILHGHAQLNSFYARRADQRVHVVDDGCSGDHGLTPNDWLTGSATALLAPLSVSTCDQVLLGSLAQRRSYMRLTAIANRHVVLDEVHTYDTFQASLLEQLLAWCGKTDTRVTILSASLPEFRLQRYSDAYGGTAPEQAIYPGTTLVTSELTTQSEVKSRRSFDLQYRIHNIPAKGLVSKHVQLALHYRRESANARIGIVVNQIDRAQEIGEILAVQHGQRVIVMHSLMGAGHRKLISDELELRLGPDSTEGGLIVIGTQVIEASLDIDFDCMISDLAPAPSLIQRAGRMWRHSEPTDGVWDHVRPRRGDNPVLDILCPLDDAHRDTLSPVARYPYLMAELKRTKASLEARDGIVAIPEDVQALVDESAITAEEAEYETHVSAEDENDEYYEELRRNRKAGNVVIPFRGQGHNRPVLSDELDYLTLSKTTTKHDLDEAATRFIDQDQETFVMVDPNGVIPFAWVGTAEEAMEATGENARELLKSTFTMTRKRWNHLPELVELIEPDDWVPASAAFRGVRVVTLTNPELYSPLLGLLRSRPVFSD